MTAINECVCGSPRAQMVKERKEELEVVENEYKVESVQHRFPNDDLQLQEQAQPPPVRRRHHVIVNTYAFRRTTYWHHDT